MADLTDLPIPESIGARQDLNDELVDKAVDARLVYDAKPTDANKAKYRAAEDKLNPEELVAYGVNYGHLAARRETERFNAEAAAVADGSKS